jgi:NAD(P)-dependent dehydrogenase (short-subunit alcohol dehydrogenase family)
VRTALVTGATDGIGLETARQLAAKGFRVLVHGRNLEKAERACERIARPLKPGRVEPVAGDLARMTEVVSLANSVAAKAPVLDVLLNNAGVHEPKRHLTEEGFESTMAVNHLAAFLLTHHLLGTVKRAPAGRIVTVSSMAHAGGANPADFVRAHGYSGYATYSASKLANVLFTVTLAKRLAGTRVTANCLHPGVIATKLLRVGFGAGGAPVETGARTSVYLATSAEVAGVSGGYFVDCRQTLASREGRDEQLAEALWAASQTALAAWL